MRKSSPSNSPFPISFHTFQSQEYLHKTHYTRFCFWKSWTDIHTHASTAYIIMYYFVMASLLLKGSNKRNKKVYKCFQSNFRPAFHCLCTKTEMHELILLSSCHTPSLTCNKANLCSGRRWLNSSLRTNWIAVIKLKNKTEDLFFPLADMQQFLT